MAEVEAGSWFDITNTVHSDWLWRRIGCGGQFYALYSPDRKPLGLCCLLIEDHPRFPGYAEILDMGILKGHRRHGHGKRLIEDAARRAAASGACCIYVSTYAGDSEAIAFYTHAGFKTVAEHPGLNGPDDHGQVFMMQGWTNKMQDRYRPKLRQGCLIFNNSRQGLRRLIRSEICHPAKASMIQSEVFNKIYELRNKTETGDTWVRNNLGVRYHDG